MRATRLYRMALAGVLLGAAISPASALSVDDLNSAAFVDWAALTADDTATANVAAGKTVEASCTVAGNISIKLANGKAKVLPVTVGWQTFPWSAVGLNSTGTTGNCTVVNWY